MAKGYFVVTEDIHDPGGMDAYGQGAVPTLGKAGGRVLVLEPNPEVIEGEWHGSRTVILEFDSVDAARDWYNSPEYQEVIGLRHAAASSNMVLLSGFEPPTG